MSGMSENGPLPNCIGENVFSFSEELYGFCKIIKFKFGETVHT